MTNPYTVQTVRCAGPGCSNVRREANHWFVCALADSGSVWADGKVFVCFPFDVRRELDEHDQPVCGQACAQRLFESWMQEQSK
jgi:hypothetical protein